MNDSSTEKEKKLRDMELAFFGGISASVTHEINNVISLIGEMSGLLGDLAVAAEKGRPLEPEKLKKISGTVARHIERGAALVKRFNRFAHTVDEPMKTVDVGETIENLVGLCQRLSARRNSALCADLSENNISITTRPFGLLHAVFICIAAALNSGENGEAVVAFQKTSSGVDIVIRARPVADIGGIEAAVLSLKDVLAELKGEYRTAAASGQTVETTLSFPDSIAGE